MISPDSIVTDTDRQLFLYWQLDSSHVGAALQALRAWQQQLRNQQPQLRAHLFVRANTDSGRSTLMESYAVSPTQLGIDARLQCRLVDEGNEFTSAWRIGTRHLEVFFAQD